MKQTPEAELIIVKGMLEAVKRDGLPPETIAFWEQAVRDCEQNLVAHKPVEKPE